MIQFCVLKASEFLPIAAAARSVGMQEADFGDYLLLSSHEDIITIHSNPSEIPDAVWFGALTGGFGAELVSIDQSQLTLAASRARNTER
jgi:hypothetical protein